MNSHSCRQRRAPGHGAGTVPAGRGAGGGPCRGRAPRPRPAWLRGVGGARLLLWAGPWPRPCWRCCSPPRPSRRAPPPDPARLLARLTAGEPSIAEVQAAAARRAEAATPDPAGLARRRRMAALLPRITAQVRHEESAYRVTGLQGTSEVDYLRSSPGTSYSVLATWELGDLVVATGEAAAAVGRAGPGPAARRGGAAGHRPLLRSPAAAAGAAHRSAPRRPGADRGGAGAGPGHGRAGRPDRRVPGGAAAVSRGGPRVALRLAVALGAGLAALPGCGPPAPEPHTRIAGWTPSGPGADREPLVTVDFTAPIAADGLAEGRLVALTRAADARAVARALEAGQPPGPPALAADVALTGDGRRIELRPRARLSGGTAYAVVVAPTLRDAEGRPVLDPEGHRRTFVGTFITVPGPPPRPVLTEARATRRPRRRAASTSSCSTSAREPLDLAGWRLEKRTARARWPAARWRPPPSALAPGAFGLLTGGAWDGRYPVPAGTVRFTCGRPRWPAASPTSGRRRSGCSIRPGALPPPSARGRGAALPGRGGADRSPAGARTRPATWPARWTRGRPAGATRVTPPGWCPRGRRPGAQPAFSTIHFPRSSSLRM